MAVKIFIKRSVPADKADKLLPLLHRLRIQAMNQPGYISSETLQRVDSKGDHVVISTWQAVEDWQRWATNPARIELQKQIEAILSDKTEYEIYQY